MKLKIVALLVLAFGSAKSFAGDNSYLPCLKEAKVAVQMSTNALPQAVEFFSGSILIDEAEAVQVALFRVKGWSGFFKVEQYADACQHRSPVEWLQK